MASMLQVIAEAAASMRLVDSPLANIVEGKLNKVRREVLKKRERLPHIILVGSSGVGKSTLLNHIMGKELFPRGKGKAVTAAPVRLCYDSEATPFVVLVRHLTWDKVKTSIEHLASICSSEESQSSEVNRALGTLREICKCFCTTAMQNGLLESLRNAGEWKKGANTPTLLNRNTWKGMETALGRTSKFSLDNTRSVYDCVMKYAGNIAGCMWFLAEEVTIYTNTCPWLGRTVLVDLPGCNDANPVRDGVYKDYIEKAFHIVVLIDANRVGTDPTADDFLAQRNQIMMDGAYGYMTFVITKCDDADHDNKEELREEFTQELRNKLDDTLNMSTLSMFQIHAVDKHWPETIDRVRQEIAAYASSITQKEDQFIQSLLRDIMNEARYHFDPTIDGVKTPDIGETRRRLKTMSMRLVKSLVDAIPNADKSLGKRLVSRGDELEGLGEKLERHISDRHYMTIQASMKRDGNWNGIHLNSTASTYFLQPLTDAWDALFNHELKAFQERLRPMVEEVVRTCIADVTPVHHTAVNTLVNTIFDAITLVAEKQKRASRNVSMHAERLLGPVYVECRGKSGTGAKSAILATINHASEKHLKSLGNTTWEEVEDIFLRIEKCIRNAVQTFHSEMVNSIDIIIDKESARRVVESLEKSIGQVIA